MKRITPAIVLLSVSTGLLSVRAAAPFSTAPAPGGDIGQEMRKVQQNLNQATPATEKKSPEVTLPADQKSADVPVSGNEAGKLFQSLEIRGDAQALDRALLRGELEGAIVGKRLSAEALKNVAADFQKKLVDAGFFLAVVTVLPASADPASSVCVIGVDAGRVGEVVLYKRGSNFSQPYDGRWYSAAQILRRMTAVKTGDMFYYPDLYRTVYNVNAHPDLSMDVNLKLHTTEADGLSHRTADVQTAVKDRIPLHATLTLVNDGTDVTKEWHAGLTLQDVNLTKHDDVLTINAPFSLDLSTVRSIGGNYYLPYQWHKGGGLSAFAGYSKLQSKDVVTALDLNGDGWFAGAQATYNIIANDRHFVSAGLGFQHNVIKDELVVSGVRTPRQFSLSPLTFALAYNSAKQDRWGGLNSAASTLSLNRSGFLGSSSDTEFNLQRENAPSDYWVERIQLARIQPLQNIAKDPNRQWNVFARINGQYGSDPLVPAEQMGEGGSSTVRGYKEREVIGDDGINGSLELRTPTRKTSLLPRWFSKTPDTYPEFEAMQLLTFLDAGYVSVKDQISGQAGDYTLAGAGVGLRLSIGNNVAARADWGFPLKQTTESTGSGRGNFSVQVQF